MKISNFSIKRPVFTIVTMLLVIILGAVSFFKIPVTLIPELNPPIGVVVTNYSGASPTEVNEKVTKPLESTLSTLPGIKSIQSTSQEGANFMMLEFNWSTDINKIQTDVLQRIDQTPIPSEANRPQFLKFDPAQFPVIQLTLQATGDKQDVRILAEKLEKDLLRTEGVASVNISGNLIEEMRITLDKDKLVKNGLTQADIVSTIQGNNVSLPGDPIETGQGQQLTVRVLSTLSSVNDLKTLIVKTNPLNGDEIQLQDIANVKVAEQPTATITRANEHPAVLMSVLQESGANTAEVSKNFQTSLNTLLAQKQYEGVKADILFNQGDYVKLAIDNIGSSLIYGGIFAMLVLFVFLRGIRSPIIIAVAIPYSVIVTFVLMYFANFSLNILTLGALALGIGMLVDNAIVVIENIERHLGMGKTPKQAASEGTKEVAIAIIASTLTTVAVFVPVIFITGLIGQIFTEFALTISFSLIASLVVALTVVPMMAGHMLKRKPEDIEEKRSNSKRYTAFKNSVEWAIKHRFLVLAVTLFLLVLSVFGLTRTGMEFLPSTDEGFFSISVKLKNGSALSKTEEVVQLIEDRLKKEKDVAVYVSFIGGNQQTQSRGNSKANEAELSIKLVSLDKRKRSVFEFVDDIQKDVQQDVGNRADVSFNMQTASGSAPNTLTFRVSDTNHKRLNQAVEDIQKKIEAISDITEVENDLNNTVEEIQVNVKQQKASELGFVPAQIAQTVQQMTKGVTATQILTNQEEVQSVVVNYGETYKKSIEQLKKLQLRSATGEFVELQDVAEVKVQEGPVSIRRTDQLPSVAFILKYKSTQTLTGAGEKVDKVIKELNLPESTSIKFSGDRELFDESINDMLLAIVLAVILVYIVMAAQFESFKYPFVIMFTVPLMVIGVALALVLTNTPIGVTAIIGILVLVGIVVNNGIVLVDYINQRKAAGVPSFEAIVTSARDRLRPILMTASTTVLGLIPLAIGLGEGTEMNQPMGIAVIGGLVSSTFLTLYIVPIVYSLFDRETRFLHKKRKA
ncbi:efflux RND transporter permease subunit [Viridibacillus arvi]|uniref:efflux RND transporter permease subunit n=1 Tax=Viridibacillus arvi TaxID=263475 RepID=UPI00187B41BB|nr:efflux RND transporter permease subunit [Viridibacillus sp. JNUCC-6]QOV10625.1 efflux RND transporter permease subunit [Viridibacillus sp. JNUCC-6]